MSSAPLIRRKLNAKTTWAQFVQTMMLFRLYLSASKPPKGWNTAKHSIRMVNNNPSKNSEVRIEESVENDDKVVEQNDIDEEIEN